MLEQKCFTSFTHLSKNKYCKRLNNNHIGKREGCEGLFSNRMRVQILRYFACFVAEKRKAALSRKSAAWYLCQGSGYYAF